ncbi:MAG: LCP family protein [Anaerovoracaceae bacterium]|jgi:LCP family protein required for cell wall assembly
MKETFDKTRIVDGESGDDRLTRDVIRKYENPEYKKAAEEYERLARRSRGAQRREKTAREAAAERRTRRQRETEPQRRSFRRAEREERRRARRSHGRISQHNEHRLAQQRADGSNMAAGAGSTAAARQEAGAGSSRRNGAGRPHSTDRNGAGRPHSTDRNGVGRRHSTAGARPLAGGGTAAAVRRPPLPRGRRIKRIVLAVLVILAALAVAFTAWFFAITSHLDHVDTSSSDFAIDNQVAADLKGYRSIAILGVDARKGESLDGSRTDAIIIMRIRKSNGHVQLISIMRDSYLKMADSSGSLILDKITHAHHYGGGVDTCAALNRSLDLNIDEYIIFDWQAVADTVDTLGGIEVNVKRNEIRDLNKWGPETAKNVGSKWTPITKTGRQTIDGVQATTYCRIRKTSGGDPGRGSRYKKVMSAVMKKAVSSPVRMNKLAATVLPEIRTNMSQVQLLTAAVNFPRYDIRKSYGWPKDYYGGLLSNGLWYAVPTTLESNVQTLHKKAFAQNNYTLSETCSEISREIIYSTGITEGNN